MSRNNKTLRVGSIVTWIDTGTTFVITKIDGEGAIGLVVGVGEQPGRRIGSRMGLDPSWELAIAPQTVFELAEGLGEAGGARDRLKLCQHSRPFMAKVKALSALIDSVELLGNGQATDVQTFVMDNADTLRRMLWEVLGEKLRAEFRRDLISLAPKPRRAKR